MTRTPNRAKMTRAQKQWDTIARHNYVPADRSIPKARRQAAGLASLYRHFLLSFGPDGAANYEELTGRADARAVGVMLAEMIQRLEKIAKGEGG